MSLVVDIRKRLGSFALDVSFDLAEADGVLGLLGASGCGKSLTLRCIAGIERPDEGRITLDGRTLFDSSAGINLKPQERHVGYLFQHFALFPHMTVEQNVMVGARGSTKQARGERVRACLRRLQLEGLERRLPAELSGGQQQRCALARILVGEPRLLLLDEPFSALDNYLRWQLELELSDVIGQFGGTTVLVSHDRDEIYRLCDAVCVLNEGTSDALVTTKHMFAQPKSLGAAIISGCKNISRVHMLEDGCLWCEDWGVALACEGVVSPRVTHVGIRAHYLAITGETNAIPCTVERIIDNTFSTIVMLRTPGTACLRYELDKDAWAALGNPSQLTVHIVPSQVMPLREGGGR